MGVASSDLDWGDPKPGSQYDIWGYNPWEGQTQTNPPQHVWSEFYRDGFPPYGRGEKIGDQTPGQKTTVPVFGGQEDILNLFGPGLKYDVDRFEYATGDGPNNMARGGASQTQPKYGKIVTPGNANWLIGNDVCTPTNYPNCDMRQFRNSAAEVHEWTGQTSQLLHGTASGVDPVSYVAELNTYEPDSQLSIDYWLEVVEDLVKAYKNNEFDALSEVNDRDTRDWDPCDDGPSFVTMVLPILGGAFTAWGSGVLELGNLEQFHQQI